jgi:hypothetical protein
VSLITFYKDETPDHAGRRIAELWRFDHAQLESEHDFIQWLFPLETPSPVNPDAPTLDAATIRAFRGSPELAANLRRSLALMLDFYGLVFTDAHTIAEGPAFSERARNWLRPMNHNHLRLTRIVRSLHLLGLEVEARALQNGLLQIAEDHPEAISGRTWHFWKTATEEKEA